MSLQCKNDDNHPKMRNNLTFHFSVKPLLPPRLCDVTCRGTGRQMVLQCCGGGDGGEAESSVS